MDMFAFVMNMIRILHKYGHAYLYLFRESLFVIMRLCRGIGFAYPYHCIQVYQICFLYIGIEQLWGEV